MPNISAVLRDEITRVSRRSTKNDLEALRKASAEHRRQIAALKRQVAALSTQLKALARRPGGQEPRKLASEADGGRALRFSATRFAAQRQKLGLSAADFARLLGVSSLSVYKWESGKTRPRRVQLEAIAAARGLGKREAAARLEKLAA